MNHVDWTFSEVFSSSDTHDAAFAREGVRCRRGTALSKQDRMLWSAVARLRNIEVKLVYEVQREGGTRTCLTFHSDATDHRRSVSALCAQQNHAKVIIPKILIILKALNKSRGKNWWFYNAVYF